MEARVETKPSISFRRDDNAHPGGSRARGYVSFHHQLDSATPRRFYRFWKQEGKDSHLHSSLATESWKFTVRMWKNVIFACRTDDSLTLNWSFRAAQELVLICSRGNCIRCLYFRSLQGDEPDQIVTFVQVSLSGTLLWVILPLQGVINLSPYSYFNFMSQDPPVFCIGTCSTAPTEKRPSYMKDSQQNIVDTG